MPEMRCADEKGWPVRDFERITAEGEAPDHVCPECGWHQVDFARGCRELVLSADWHDTELLSQYLTVVREAGLGLDGKITLKVQARAASTPEKLILVMGSPADGLTFHGPYTSGDDVDAEHRDLRNNYWWLVELQPPLSKEGT
jgi:hypothetical protein